MSLLINIRHLEKDAVHVAGEESAESIDLQSNDELIRVTGPVVFDLEVQRLEKGILIQGNVSVRLECNCVRCLEPFDTQLELKNWACHLALEGEEAVAIQNDSVDLTPHMREDIFLAFPQHPLCSPECRGLLQEHRHRLGSTRDTGRGEGSPSAWADLDKLDL